VANSPPSAADDASANPLTRRNFLRLVNLGAAAALAGCATERAPTAASSFGPAPAPTLIGAHQGPATTLPAPDNQYAPPPGFKAPPYSPPVQAVFPATLANGIIPRAAWTHAGPAKPCLLLGGVNLLTFHHDGDPVPFADTDYGKTAAYLERIRAYHVRTGFEDIGYHYAIDRAGRVWELRSHLLRGEHVRAGYDDKHVLHKWNDNNLGIVVLGNFMLQQPTAAQQQRICSFGLQLRKQYYLSIEQIRVHQELVTTECPGVHLRPYMDQVRARRLI
jgi:hypothetical protein